MSSLFKKTNELVSIIKELDIDYNKLKNDYDLNCINSTLDDIADVTADIEKVKKALISLLSELDKTFFEEKLDLTEE